MPVYEFECEEHGVFEEIFVKPVDIDSMQCKYFEEGMQCQLTGHRIFSLTAIKTDDMWSGIQTDYGYFTSKCQFENHLKQNNIARYEPGMKEQYQRKAKERKEEAAIKNEKHIEKLCVDVVSKI